MKRLYAKNTSFQKIKAPIFGAFFNVYNAPFLSIILGLTSVFEQLQLLDAPFLSKLANFENFFLKIFC
jgi:hypothetical protein